MGWVHAFSGYLLSILVVPFPFGMLNAVSLSLSWLAALLCLGPLYLTLKDFLDLFAAKRPILGHLKLRQGAGALRNRCSVERHIKSVYFAVAELDKGYKGTYGFAGYVFCLMKLKKEHQMGLD